METKSSKQFGGSATSLWDRYHTDLFFRTTCHIIVLQVVFTVIVVVGLWFEMESLMKDTTETLTSTFTQMLQGKTVTADNVGESLKDIRASQFVPTMVASTALMLCFGFIIVYVALTPTRRSMERQKRFISNIAHELRTPLAIIQTNTDVALLNTNVPTELRETLQNNSLEISRISEIMNNLLSLSNFTQDKQLKFEDVDLSIIVQKVLDTLEETSNHKDITLALKTHTNQAVLGNAVALEQVVFNLVKNAITHTQARGLITIEIEPSADGKYIDLAVSDSGRGITRNDLFHIFEPFYRARTSPKDGGKGLGLAIVNEIVQMHRGKIKIRSTEGQGTKVVVSVLQSTQGIASKSDTEELSMDFSHRILR